MNNVSSSTRPSCFSSPIFSSPRIIYLIFSFSLTHAKNLTCFLDNDGPGPGWECHATPHVTLENMYGTDSQATGHAPCDDTLHKCVHYHGRDYGIDW